MIGFLRTHVRRIALVCVITAALGGTVSNATAAVAPAAEEGLCDVACFLGTLACCALINCDYCAHGAFECINWCYGYQE